MYMKQASVPLERDVMRTDARSATKQYTDCYSKNTTTLFREFTVASNKAHVLSNNLVNV